MGDQNGWRSKDQMVDKYGEDNGSWLIELYEEFSLKIINGFFSHQDTYRRHRYGDFLNVFSNSVENRCSFSSITRQEQTNPVLSTGTSFEGSNSYSSIVNSSANNFPSKNKSCIVAKYMLPDHYKLENPLLISGVVVLASWLTQIGVYSHRCYIWTRHNNTHNAQTTLNTRCIRLVRGQLPLKSTAGFLIFSGLLAYILLLFAHFYDLHNTPYSSVYSLSLFCLQRLELLLWTNDRFFIW